ncbi:MAG TPA: chemotaxis response regulator protein-glutamate methylesterase [Clostridiaceae bacterium]|nr:chemotaxis response regulator protein-glutamate methylesterase [Clostridiaceae bacterium]
MIEVLVVDDSALMRRIISDMINQEDNMCVAGTAKDGEELLEKIETLKPDIITLDVEMPKLNGIEALLEMKKRQIDIPVIMLSSVSSKGPMLTMQCLEAGAFDFIPKPSGEISLDISKVKSELAEKINLAYEKRPSSKESFISGGEGPSRPEEKTPAAHVRINAVVIGASTGGPRALYAVITKLPEDLGVPVFIVQHMPEGFTKAFADRLNTNSMMKVQEASHLQLVEINNVYIAPGGYHMEVMSDNKIHLNREPSIWGVRPAADRLFSSAAEVYGTGLLSVVLTGMGRDGAKGTEDVKNAGGTTISEDESTCVIYGMPKAAYETGKVDFVSPVDKISDKILKLVCGDGR